MDVEEFLNGFVLLGVPAIVLIPFIVEGLKRLGLRVEWATWAAVIVGLVVCLAIEAVRLWPDTAGPMVRVIVGGLVLGFASSGVYSRFRSKH